MGSWALDVTILVLSLSSSHKPGHRGRKEVKRRKGRALKTPTNSGGGGGVGGTHL